MKLRKAIKLAAAGAAVTASASVLAVPTFDNWSSAGGVVTANCPTGYTCSTSPISESGFLQRQLTETSTGRTFIQSILVTGDYDGVGAPGVLTGAEMFVDENFVEVGGHGGIMDQQQLHEQASGTNSGTGVTVTESFDTASNILSGAFRTTDVVAIDIYQMIAETTTAGEDFGSSFQLQEMDNSSFGGNITAKVNLGMDVSGDGFTNKFGMETFNVEDTTGAFTSGNYKKLDVDQNMVGEVTQEAHLRERTGAAVAGPGGTDADSNITFLANDTIVSLRIGQDVAGAGSFGLDDFVNESQATSVGIDSLATSNIPFQTITYTDTNLGDPFAAIPSGRMARQ